MVDNGYDISDYMDIDPSFGTMEDMKELIEEAKKRGIRILMDLVVNHSSDRHAWFQAALKDPFGKYGKYYVFREGITSTSSQKSSRISIGRIRNCGKKFMR